MAMSAVYTNFGRKLVHENRSGTETKYVSDPLGSLVGTLDVNQNVTSTAEYWPYGEVQATTGNNPSPWGFVGLLGYLKDFAFLLYVRARFLLPSSARWLTKDPLWPAQRAYSYTSRPVSEVDPSGLMSNPGCDGKLQGCLARANEHIRNCLIAAGILCAAASAALMLCVLLCGGNPACIVFGCGLLRQGWYLACLALPFACHLEMRQEVCQCYSDYNECTTQDAILIWLDA